MSHSFSFTNKMQINPEKTCQELKIKKSVFALISEHGSNYIFKTSGTIVTKGCNTFEGQYGTQHSIGIKLDEPNDLAFLFEPTVAIKHAIRSWTRKPVLKNETLFLKLKAPIECVQGQQVSISANAGIYFNVEAKCYSVYFSNVIVD